MAERRAARPKAAVIVSVAVAAVAGVFVTAAALDNGDDGTDRSTTTTTASQRRTTTTVARAFPADEEWSITTATILPPALTTTTSSPTTTTMPALPPVSPPAPGGYAYAEETTPEGQQGEEAEGDVVERTYRIEDRPPAEGEQRVPGELQFLITLETEGGRVTTITSWRTDGVLALQTFFRMTEPEAEGNCDWVPDVLQLQRPLTEGASWSYGTSCTADFDSQQVRIDRTGEFRVQGDERVELAGEDVAAWRIESKETTRFSGAFERTDQEIRVFWFSPKHGLTVREEARQRHTTPDGTTAVRVERELLRLRPV